MSKLGKENVDNIPWINFVTDQEIALCRRFCEVKSALFIIESEFGSLLAKLGLHTYVRYRLDDIRGSIEVELDEPLVLTQAQQNLFWQAEFSQLTLLCRGIRKVYVPLH